MSKLNRSAAAQEFNDQYVPPVGGAFGREPASLKWARRPSVDWNHLSDLVRQAVEEAGFQDNLPWNLSNMVNAGQAPGRYRRHEDGKVIDRAVRNVARFCGWLRAVGAGKFPAIKKVIAKTHSSRGMNSPRTTIEFWRLVEKFPSPGGLERKLWAVRERAEAIFTAYEGQKPSWRAIAAALLVEARIGKAAIIAVAGTISGKSFRSYREARQWLVEYHQCCVRDTSDGVEARREAEPRLVRHGCSVYRIAIRDRYHHTKFEWLVRSSGRTFHTDGYAWVRGRSYSGAEGAIHAAVQAWRVAKAEARELANAA